MDAMEAVAVIILVVAIVVLVYYYLFATSRKNYANRFWNFWFDKRFQVFAASNNQRD